MNMTPTPRDRLRTRPPHRRPEAAKRAVAIALRNRWRRQQVDEPLRSEITPKNILMIGPTGVGKTEIARRLAKLADAPFIKVEATKFTEVGYVGKRRRHHHPRPGRSRRQAGARPPASKRKVRKAEDAAEERMLDVLVPPPRVAPPTTSGFDFTPPRPRTAMPTTPRQVMRKRLREGSARRQGDRDRGGRHGGRMRGDHGPPGMEEMAEQLKGDVRAGGPRPAQEGQRKLKIVRCAEAAGRGRSRQARQRGRDPPAAAHGQRGAERHRLPRRDRQGGQPLSEHSGADVSRARVCSATCCRWWKAPPSIPSTAW